MRDSLEQMQLMLSVCVAALKDRLDEQGWQANAEDEEGWARLFGKESVVGALSKLVSMHKSLMEQQQESAVRSRHDQQQSAPLSEAEWQILALAVQRRFSPAGGVQPVLRAAEDGESDCNDAPE